MLHRLMSRLAEAGRRERDRMQAKPGAAGAALSPGRLLGTWFSFLRPDRLLKLLGAAAVVLAIVYVIEFRSAAEWARAEAGASATAERVETLTVARLALTSCAGTRRSCGVLPGKQWLYRSVGSAGTAAVFAVAGAGLFLLGWGLARRR